MGTQQHLVNIVVVDDHPVVLSGIVSLLERHHAFRVIASCTDAMEAIELIRTRKPNLALVDMNMPGLNGLAIMDALNRESQPPRIIILAASLTDKEIVGAVEGGAHGIIFKESAPATLIACLRAVASGEKWLPTDLVNNSIERMREHRKQIEKISHLLTPREMEVMLRVAEGFTNKEVSCWLKISEGTVKMHLHSIYHKVGVSNRTSLANFAIALRDQMETN